METFNTIIEKATKHDSEALNTLITLMTPLLRKYASKIHFMDFDDAMQELSLTLVECLQYGSSALLRMYIDLFRYIWYTEGVNNYECDGILNDYKLRSSTVFSFRISNSGCENCFQYCIY